jgi:hypothetical protein
VLSSLAFLYSSDSRVWPAYVLNSGRWRLPATSCQSHSSSFRSCDGRFAWGTIPAGRRMPTYAGSSASFAPAGLRHPAELGEEDVTRFLSGLAEAAG